MLALSGCLNVLLNLFFVIVLKMTVNGVAIATVISNAISSIVLFIVLMKSDKYIKLSLRELRIDKEYSVRFWKSVCRQAYRVLFCHFKHNNSGGYQQPRNNSYSGV